MSIISFSDIEKLYSFRIKDIEIIKPKRVIKLFTTKGIKVFKKWNISLAEINYMIDISNSLINKIRTINILETSNSRKYFQLDDSYYYVYDFVEGVDLSRRNVKNVLEGSKTLALFHKELQGLNIKVPSRRMQYHILENNIITANEKINQLYQQVKKEDSDIYPLFSRFYPYYRHQVESSLEIVPNLRKHIIESKKKQQVCHGDSGFRNFINSRKGIYIIDMESFQQNSVIYDLVKFVKSMHWKTKLIRKSLERYLKYSGCSINDIILLLKILDIPFEFASYTAQYLRLRRNAYLFNLNEFIEYENVKKKCINSLQQYFGK